MIEQSKTEAKDLGLTVCVKGHIGDGNFHENITYSPKDSDEAANTELAVKNMVKRALERDGTCTGEHGIGFGKKDGLAAEVGSDTLLLMVSPNSFEAAGLLFPSYTTLLFAENNFFALTG